MSGRLDELGYSSARYPTGAWGTPHAAQCYVWFLTKGQVSDVTALERQHKPDVWVLLREKDLPNLADAKLRVKRTSVYSQCLRRSTHICLASSPSSSPSHSRVPPQSPALATYARRTDTSLPAELRLHEVQKLKLLGEGQFGTA